MIAGSDAHTLRRVGRTWTSAPGRTREEFIESLRLGLGTPGGDHGGTWAVAGDAYGVIAAYVASLGGVGVIDHSVPWRAAYLTFVALSLPFQFLPVAIAFSTKARERREVMRAEAYLAARQATPAPLATST